MNLQRVITSNSRNDQDSPGNDGGVDDDYDEYNDDRGFQLYCYFLKITYCQVCILNATLN